MKKFYWNVVANFTARFLPPLAWFLLTPFIVHKLGEESYGLWALSQAMVGVSGLLDLGITPTVSKLIAAGIAKRDDQAIVTIASTIFVVYSGLGLIAALAFLVFGRYLAISAFNVPLALHNETRAVMYILAIQVGLSMPLNLFDGIVQGQQAFVFRSLVSILSTILNVLLIYVLIPLGFGLLGLVSIGFAVQLLRGACYILYVPKMLPRFSICPSEFSWARARNLLGFSLQIFILQICALLILQSNKFLIGIMMSLAAVTQFEVGLKIHNVVRSLVTSVQAVVVPTASEMNTINNRRGLQDLLVETSRHVLMIFVAVAVPVIAMARPFISWWMGDGFEQAAYVLMILMIGQAFNALNFVSGQIFIGIGDLKIYAWVRMIGSISNVVLSILLLQRLGVLGAAVGTTIHFAIADSLLIIFFLRKLQIPVSRYIHRCIIPVLIPAISSSLFLVAAQATCKVDNLADFVIAGMTCLVLFSLLLFAFGFDASERQFFKHAPGRMFLTLRSWRYELRSQFK